MGARKSPHAARGMRAFSPAEECGRQDALRLRLLLEVFLLWVALVRERLPELPDLPRRVVRLAFLPPIARELSRLPRAPTCDFPSFSC